MSLPGEEVVEEWLNRNGYFTIRGIKVGVDEIDILAIRPLSDGKYECRHIEVQVSINAISYCQWESKSVPPPALDQSQDAVVFPGFSF
jgi:hypothetical protein